VYAPNLEVICTSGLYDRSGAGAASGAWSAPMVAAASLPGAMLSDDLERLEQQ
jgi:hypothetical protein